MIPRRLFTIAAILITSVYSAADPDFSGLWKLNEQRSEIHGLPAAPEKEMSIDHKGSVLRCGQPPTVRAMTTDGKETRTKSGGNEERNILKWEGAALLINTIVRTPTASYTQMDRWKLSRDGRTLSIRRQIVTLRGETESTLIYEKVTEPRP